MFTIDQLWLHVLISAPQGRNEPADSDLCPTCGGAPDACAGRIHRHALRCQLPLSAAMRDMYPGRVLATCRSMSPGDASVEALRRRLAGCRLGTFRQPHSSRSAAAAASYSPIWYLRRTIARAGRTSHAKADRSRAARPPFAARQRPRVARIGKLPVQRHAAR